MSGSIYSSYRAVLSMFRTTPLAQLESGMIGLPISLNIQGSEAPPRPFAILEAKIPLRNLPDHGYGQQITFTTKTNHKLVAGGFFKYFLQ